MPTLIMPSDWISLETAQEILARFERQYPADGQPKTSCAEIEPKKPLSPELIQQEGIKIDNFFFDAKRNLTDWSKGEIINLVQKEFSGRAISSVHVSWNARFHGVNALQFRFTISLLEGKMNAGLFFGRDETSLTSVDEDARKLDIQRSFAKAMGFPLRFELVAGKRRVWAPDRELLYVPVSILEKQASDGSFNCSGGYSHDFHDKDIAAHCERLLAWIGSANFEVLPLVEFSYHAEIDAGSEKVTEWYLDLASRFDSVEEWEGLYFSIEIPNMEALLECRRLWPGATLSACVAWAEIGESDYINLTVEAGKKGFRVVFEMTDPDMMPGIRKLAGVPFKRFRVE